MDYNQHVLFYKQYLEYHMIHASDIARAAFSSTLRPLFLFIYYNKRIVVFYYFLQEKYNNTIYIGNIQCTAALVI